jgi:hypothetical protein
MAERATSAEALAFTLTYRDLPHGERPEGSQVFQYRDVQTFLKKLRKAYAKQYNGATGEIRYIVAGEIGSKGTKRVHWHMALFADRPITALGEWERPSYHNPQNSKTKDLWIWSIWDHGHVDLKQPDQGGFAYVVKYALKDMFNVVKSKRTMREAKSENHGASYFRVSKHPPIGFRYLERKLDRLEQRLQLLPSLDIKVEGYSGFWWPRTGQREYLLDRLHDINKKSNAELGRDAPQWTSLLASVSEENTKDWERLVYGTEKEIEIFDEFEEQDRIGSELSAIRRQCGGAVPCKQCAWDTAGKLDPAVRKTYEALRKEHEASGSRAGFDRWVKHRYQINPCCQLKDDQSRKDAFRRSGDA